MMRFRRWPRPTAYADTPRKRAAFLRKQRLECEALPLFADEIAATQRGFDENGNGAQNGNGPSTATELDEEPKEKRTAPRGR